ncbi:MAG: site-specific integrase, partial [Acetobacteraceae bacterium]|nr:site-specific integrase [Acetobacteraceae bacterium]
MIAAERGAARNTLSAYAADLADFARFAVTRGQGLATADASLLQIYIAALDSAGLTARTAARRVSVLRQFYRFLLREGFRADNPTSLLDAPRLGKPIPKYLTEQEVDSLLESAAQRGALAHAAVEILYATGLRVSELLALPRSALAPNASVLLVRGKGGRERMVPLSEPAKDAAAALPARARWLFPGRDPRRPMTRQGFAL